MIEGVPGASPQAGAVRWRQLLSAATDRLRAGGFDNAAQEARWLVQRAGGFETADMVTALDEPVTERGGTHLHVMLERRLQGEPLQYVLGRWQFRTLELVVDDRVLIPRPETEVLAGFALDEVRRLGARRAVDLGTGSGAIALALAVEQPRLEVWGTDASPDALAVARANLAGLGRAATRVRLTSGAWFEALPADLLGQVGVIVSNPPYVAEHEVADLPADVRDWEPREALVAAGDGLADIRHIVTHAADWLTRPGTVLIEMAPRQVHAAKQAALDAGFASVEVWPDLAGHDRVVVARV